jgi:ketosteroid isomerase-like protein
MSKDIEALRSGYEALSERDVEGWLEGFDRDAELHELADIPDSAVYRGHDGLRRWAAGALELAGQWTWTPEEFVSAPNGRMMVRVRFQARGSGSGTPVEQTVFHVFELRDAKVIVIRGFLDHAEAVEAAGL